jgi:hypothetical protein
MVVEAWKRGPGRGGNSTAAPVTADSAPPDIAAGATAENEVGGAPVVCVTDAVAAGAGSMTTRQQGVRDGWAAVRAACP